MYTIATVYRGNTIELESFDYFKLVQSNDSSFHWHYDCHALVIVSEDAHAMLCDNAFALNINCSEVCDLAQYCVASPFLVVQIHFSYHICIVLTCCTVNFSYHFRIAPIHYTVNFKGALVFSGVQ